MPYTTADVAIDSTVLAPPAPTDPAASDLQLLSKPIGPSPDALQQPSVLQLSSVLQ